MQTFNNFNELAAGQTTLHSDMSVFNGAAPPTGAQIKDIALKASALVTQIQETFFNNGKQYPVSEAMHAHLTQVITGLSRFATSARNEAGLVGDREIVSEVNRKSKDD